jgi:hypothetical protein
MSPEYEKKLEERIHQELVKLPERAAPDTLIASVLATLEARAARPWWRRPIPQWPRRNQFLFVTVMLALVAGAVAGLWQAWPHDAIQEIPTQAAAAIDPVRPALNILETLTRAAALLVASLSQPWLIALGLGFLFVYLSCIGMGMAWYRITFQKGVPRLAHA